MLKIGRKAPSFKLLDQNEISHSSKKYLDKLTIIYFYPKDDTPGCTKEACVIAEIYKDFKKLGVTVFGVSKDLPKTHKKFAEKYKLPFTLLSDPTMKMMNKYGAAFEKQMYGKTVRGTNRITYLVDEAGKIAKVYEKVDPASHALQLLADIKEFKKKRKKARD